MYRTTVVPVVWVWNLVVTYVEGVRECAEEDVWAWEGRSNRGVEEIAWYRSGDPVRGDEMSRACDTYGVEGECVKKGFGGGTGGIV